MKPTVGRIVHYAASLKDAADINRRREDFRAFCRENPRPDEHGTFPGSSGHIGHYGVQVLPGNIYPAIIVSIHDDTTVNLQVLLDGNDSFWACRRSLGNSVGEWSWPVKEIGTPITDEQQKAALTRVT